MNPPAVSRRQTLALLGTGAAAAALPGCAYLGGGNSANSVSWQAIPSYSLAGTDPRRVGYLKTQLSAFSGAAKMKIDPRVSTADTAVAMSKLLLQASQHRAPDVAQVDVNVFGRMYRYAKPLDQVLADHRLDLADWFPSLRHLMTGNGQGVRGLQFTTDVRALYYRRDVVPRPPATWDEVVSVAKPLARKGLQVLLPAGPSEGAVTTSLWPQYWNQGAELFDSAGRPAFFSGRSHQAMLAALGVVEELVGQGVTPTSVANFGSEDDSNADIVAGRVAMFLGGSWQATVLNNLMPKNDFFTSWGVAPLPSITGERHVTSAGGWVWAAFTGEQSALRTGMDWLVKTFVSDEGMAAWCSAGGYLPPRRSVYDRPDYVRNAFTPIFREYLETYAKTRPADRKYLDVSRTMQIALSSVASRSLSAEAALEQALNRLV